MPHDLSSLGRKTLPIIPTKLAPCRDKGAFAVFKQTARKGMVIVWDMAQRLHALQRWFTLMASCGRILQQAPDQALRT